MGGSRSSIKKLMDFHEKPHCRWLVDNIEHWKVIQKIAREKRCDYKLLIWISSYYLQFLSDEILSSEILAIESKGEFICCNSNTGLFCIETTSLLLKYFHISCDICIVSELVKVDGKATLLGSNITVKVLHRWSARIAEQFVVSTVSNWTEVLLADWTRRVWFEAWGCLKNSRSNGGSKSAKV